MKTLLETISGNILEGLFGDIDKEIDKFAAKSAIQDMFKGKYKIMSLKDGTYKVWGNLTCDNYDSEVLPPLNISYLEGSVYIENCDKLTSIAGLFSPNAKVKGGVYITNCKSFNSLQGSPWNISGSMSVVDCPKLKSLEGLPQLVDKLTIMKCGKKWTKEQITKVLGNQTIKICCSLDEQYAMITEAMSEPYLLRFWQMCKDCKYKFKLSELNSNVRFDQIRPSDVTEFDVNDKGLHKALLNAYREGNFVLALNDKDEFIYMGSGAVIYTIPSNEPGYGDESQDENIPYWKRPNRRIDGHYRMKMGEWVSFLENPRQVKTVVVYDPTDKEDRWSIQNARRELKKGIVTPESYEQILKDNRDRYKAAIEQLKLKKQQNAYKQLADEVAKLNNRAQAGLKKMVSDFEWVRISANKSNITKALDRVSKVNAKFVEIAGILGTLDKGVPTGSHWYTTDRYVKERTIKLEELAKLMDDCEKVLKDLGL